MTAPLFFFWEGDAFRPIPRHAKECDKRFVIGQSYCLDEIHDRLPRSHRHFFAAVHEGWMNLPRRSLVTSRRLNTCGSML